MKKSTISVMGVVVVGVLSTITSGAATLFTEDFGSLADGTAITVDNTAFTYARVSTGGGSYLNVANPGALDGASALMYSSSTSLSGLGVLNGTYPAFDVGTFSFSFHTPASFSGANNLFAFAGSGTTFSGNSVFSGNDLALGFAISGGQLQTRNSGNTWVDVGSPLDADTSYDLHIVFNGSSSTVVYGTASDSIAAGTADVWLNGSLFGDDVSIRDAVSASAFRLYTTGTAAEGAYEIDNLVLADSALAVPEPSAFSLGAGCMLSTLAGLTRKRRKGPLARENREAAVGDWRPQ